MCMHLPETLAQSCIPLHGWVTGGSYTGVPSCRMAAMPLKSLLVYVHCGQNDSTCPTTIDTAPAQPLTQHLPNH